MTDTGTDRTTETPVTFRGTGWDLLVVGGGTAGIVGAKTAASLGASVLHGFTTAMLATRGRPEPGDLAAFLAAGYTEQHVLAVILAIAIKTISNYTNHLFDTPVDQMFARRTWSGTA